MSCDIEDSATRVADLRRGICIVNLRSAGSPVCPFRWPQSGQSWQRSLPVRALGWPLRQVPRLHEHVGDQAVGCGPRKVEWHTAPVEHD